MVNNSAWLYKLQKGCTLLASASDKAYQLLAHGRWFSPGTPASSTTKTGRHEIAEIFLKVALNTINYKRIINNSINGSKSTSHDKIRQKTSIFWLGHKHEPGPCTSLISYYPFDIFKHLCDLWAYVINNVTYNVTWVYIHHTITDSLCNIPFAHFRL